MLLAGCKGRVLRSFILFLCSLPLRTFAEVDFLVFSEVTVGHEDSQPFSEKNIIPSIDVFASGNLGPILVLVEAFASESVQHVERLQFGINVSDSSRAWLGRHHNPFGYWHTQYHHGTYLQTSVSRPALVELGGAGGIVPSHTTGALFEGEIEGETAAWHYAFSAGLTSRLDAMGGGHHGGGAASSLGDLDIFNAKPDEHELAYSFRLAYLPDTLGENQLGGFATRANIALTETAQVTAGDGQDIALDIIGVFANYQRGDLRVIGEWYYFSSEVPSTSDFQKASFSSAYIQTEYRLGEFWTPYARLEDTFGDDDDPYLALLDGYVRRAQTVGVRVDLAGNHAIKFEYAHRELEHNNTGRWLLSWSAVWP